ncbi:MAG: hypothetical protein IKR67_06675 [Lachnospiraceae bacterium]|nr:hypothetical protein [Lachnospiraceae bacterium]
MDRAELKQIPMTDKPITWEKFVSYCNGAAQYAAVDPELACTKPVKRKLAAQAVCKVVGIKGRPCTNCYKDVFSNTVGAEEIEALHHYGFLPEMEMFRPDEPITEKEVEALVIRATQAEVIVTDGSCKIKRDTKELCMGETAKLIDGRMFVPVSFAGVGLGGCVREDGKGIILNLNCFEDADAFTEDGYVDLEKLCNFYGVEEYVLAEGQVRALFHRYTLKNNRDLNDTEKLQAFTKFYVNYWNTPLPERLDEIAWDEKGPLFSGDEGSLPKNTLLHPLEINKLLDPDYDDPEGWCFFDDGTAGFCTRVPMPGVTPEIFDWWFAWHGLADVRYMTWYPPSHYGIWIQNGVQCDKDPFRSFDPNLDMRDKTFYLTHHPLEDFFSSVQGSDYSYKKQQNGYNSMEINPPTPFGLAFTDLGSAAGYFDREEYDRQHEAGLIAAVGQYPPSTEFGAIMCHFLRMHDGEAILHTHQWFGCTFDPVTHEFKLSPTMNYHVFRRGLLEHGIREFSNLAGIMAEIYKLEGGRPLKDTADKNYYKPGVHPNIS